MDLLIEVGLYSKWYDHSIKSDDGPFKGSTSPMVYYSTYEFKSLNTGKTTHDKSFTDDYADEVYEL